MTTVVDRRDLRADAGGMRLAILSSVGRSWIRIIEEKLEFTPGNPIALLRFHPSSDDQA